MIDRYLIKGMTCINCQSTVQRLLEGVYGVKSIQMDFINNQAWIHMDERIPIANLQEALKAYPKYSIEEVPQQSEGSRITLKPWLSTYRPLLLVFLYLSGTTLLMEFAEHTPSWSGWMQNFMSGFFLVFSFFKFLDLKGFVESYAMYDLLAKRWKAWGYIYVPLEAFLGIAYMLRYKPILTNLITLIILSINLVGVIQSLKNKKKIKCACLGVVFNLPMSKLTLVEDVLMILMSGSMLWLMR